MVPRCEDCNAVVKPDVVFFGEGLPKRFGQMAAQDFSRCDLLIILGTSLAVEPFASLVDLVPSECPRLLINLEEVGNKSSVWAFLGFSSGLGFHRADNFRDVAWLGDCDEGCLLMAGKLGWKVRIDLF